jgi:uncharacterized membrane protein
MSRVARSAQLPGISAAEAYELYTDTSRWATFIEGFKHVDRLDPTWPQEGSKVVWRSGPTGRVVVNEPGIRFETDVLEQRMTGRQAATFADGEMALVLDYRLQQGGPLRVLLDALFVRRSQGEALQRTLARFKRELAL